jgi:6-phosphogluconolactonase (cycloisomerase 2 family)
MLCSIFLTAFLTSTLATAATLYVASYSSGTWAGNITSLSLLQNPDLTYSLTQTHTLNSSTNSPSWLTLNRFNNVLYLVDEAINSTTNGNIVAYKTQYTGELTEVSRIETEVGGVHGVFFASGQALAIPHYTGGLLRTYRLYASGKEIKPSETFNFSTPDFKIGPVADRQEAPHPHQTVLDPTQQFILVPDLGADLVHVFSVDQRTMKLRQQAPLKTPAGYGPRHAVFSVDKISGNYVFYLVGELVGLVTAYSVSYAKNGLTFHKIAAYSTLDPGQHFPLNPDGSSKVAPAAIDITVRPSVILNTSFLIPPYSPMAPC